SNPYNHFKIPFFYLAFFFHIVRNDDRGKPILITSTEHIVHLSISHSKEFAVAQVVLESSSR
ncbi:hypothetical protein ACT4UT_26200, partial [Bacillus sp. B-TM1]